YRTAAYISKGMGPSGVHIDRLSCVMPLVCDVPPGGVYSDPVTDSAPWYDVEYPEPADFPGIYITNISGFDNLGSKNTSSNRFGTTVGQRNLDPKTVTVSAMLTSRSCCSTQYGYRWLLKRLLERNCDDGSETNFLSLYDCCVSG